jgi:hypothetical protein
MMEAETVSETSNTNFVLTLMIVEKKILLETQFVLVISCDPTNELQRRLASLVHAFSGVM